MSRRIAWTLALLWSVSAGAQDSPHPDLTGTWTLVRSQSSIQMSVPARVLRIDQKDGVLELSQTYAQRGRSVTSSLEVTTDGKENVSWTGDRLAVTIRTASDSSKVAKIARYSLSPDGNTLTVEERFTGSTVEHGETWVYRRTDGEPALVRPKLTLKPHGYGQADGRYPAGQPVLLQLVITNDKPVPVELWLKDHGKNGDQEPLWSLAARITDKEGKLLTRDECCADADEWWTSAVIISDSCGPRECEMPGDYVTLAPGQTVLRTAELNALVWNCPALVKMSRTSLPAGTYDVQLTVDDLVSEPIRIVVE